MVDRQLVRAVLVLFVTVPVVVVVPPTPPKQQQQYNMAPTIPTTTIPTAVKYQQPYPCRQKCILVGLGESVVDELGTDRVGATEAS